MQNPKYINIESVLERYQASAEYLSKFIATPNFSFTAGSGLSELSNAFEAEVVIPYQEIPGLPISSVSGHSGEVRLLKHNDKSCLYFADSHPKLAQCLTIFPASPTISLPAVRAVRAI